MLKTREAARRKWNKMFTKLKEYAEINGSCQVEGLLEEELALSEWCSSQRKARNQAKLTPQQIELLEELGFIWDLRDHVWNQSFSEMKLFQNEHGHTHPPTSTKLGRWAQTQRTDKRKNKLKADRKKLLDSVGFSWDAKGAHNELSAARLR